MPSRWVEFDQGDSISQLFTLMGEWGSTIDYSLWFNEFSFKKSPGLLIVHHSLINKAISKTRIITLHCLPINSNVIQHELNGINMAFCPQQEPDAKRASTGNSDVENVHNEYKKVSEIFKMILFVPKEIAYFQLSTINLWKHRGYHPCQVVFRYA